MFSHLAPNVVDEPHAVPVELRDTAAAAAAAAASTRRRSKKHGLSNGPCHGGFAGSQLTCGVDLLTALGSAFANCDGFITRWWRERRTRSLAQQVIDEEDENDASMYLQIWVVFTRKKLNGRNFLSETLG